MSYSEFTTLSKVQTAFNLVIEEDRNLFSDIERIDIGFYSFDN